MLASAALWLVVAPTFYSAWPAGDMLEVEKLADVSWAALAPDRLTRPSKELHDKIAAARDDYGTSKFTYQAHLPKELAEKKWWFIHPGGIVPARLTTLRGVVAFNDQEKEKRFVPRHNGYVLATNENGVRRVGFLVADEPHMLSPKIELRAVVEAQQRSGEFGPYRLQRHFVFSLRDTTYVSLGWADGDVPCPERYSIPPSIRPPSWPRSPVLATSRRPAATVT